MYAHTNPNIKKNECKELMNRDRHGKLRNIDFGDFKKKLRNCYTNPKRDHTKKNDNKLVVKS